MIIDTHAHLMFPEFKDDLEEVLKRASQAGVGKIINVGCSVETCRQAMKGMKKYYELNSQEKFGIELFATLGLHPYDAEFLTDDLLKDWEEKIRKFNNCSVGQKCGSRKIVAIGEIGLDYFKADVPKDVQKEAFRRQLQFALEINLPVIIHNREADEDAFDILGEFSGLKVVFHCYGSSLDFAKKLWESGFYTSFTGIITYPKASGLREVVRECQIDKWMVETDCPYLAPQKFRGQRNEPAYVVEVLKKIAEIKKLGFEECEKLQEENVKNFYGIRCCC